MSPGWPAVANPVDVYLEVGPKRTFACAIEWPGWCRSGKAEAEALERFLAYGPRYLAAIGEGFAFEIPAADDLEIVERIPGGSGTDFGVPSAEAAADARAVDEDELARLTGILEASWAAFDVAAQRAAGHALQKGPRGGGRDLEKIVDHVLEAESAYAKQIGVPTPEAEARGAPANDRMAAVRTVALAAMTDRARGVPPAENPRRTSPYWSVRYFTRRSAWHALDHAWEIEDRVLPAR
jgi:hypothetical protein